MSGQESTMVASLHLLLTGFMAGLIWFVQGVHYPLLAKVGDDRFLGYEREHIRRTTWVVAPVMILEALCAAALVGLGSTGLEKALAWTGAGLLGVIWHSTLLIQAPLHRRLSREPSRALLDRLVRTNWIRTWCWTARAVVAAWMVVA